MNLTEAKHSMPVPYTNKGPWIYMSRDDQHCCFHFLFAVMFRELSCLPPQFP